MALYAIADLHLPLGIDKPMDKFGSAWANYVERLAENWQHTVKPYDTVMIPGDFSWATYLEQSIKDFEFLNNLNGRKIISKGNHDYWWTTMSKLGKFISDFGFENIMFMQNNSYVYDKTALCGTRGWLPPECDKFTENDRKIFDREVLRLELSLKQAQKKIESGECDEIYVFLHYPPMSEKRTDNSLTALLAEYNVKKTIYGHLHGRAHQSAVTGMHNGIEYILASADYLQFMPKKLKD